MNIDEIKKSVLTYTEPLQHDPSFKAALANENWNERLNSIMGSMSARICGLSQLHSIAASRTDKTATSIFLIATEAAITLVRNELRLRIAFLERIFSETLKPENTLTPVVNNFMGIMRDDLKTNQYERLIDTADLARRSFYAACTKAEAQVYDEALVTKTIKDFSDNIDDVIALSEMLS